MFKIYRQDHSVVLLKVFEQILSSYVSFFPVAEKSKWKRLPGRTRRRGNVVVKYIVWRYVLVIIDTSGWLLWTYDEPLEFFEHLIMWVYQFLNDDPAPWNYFKAFFRSVHIRCRNATYLIFRKRVPYIFTIQIAFLKGLFNSILNVSDLKSSFPVQTLMNLVWHPCSDCIGVVCKV
jgi:hypothetical protein